MPCIKCFYFSSCLFNTVSLKSDKSAIWGEIAVIKKPILVAKICIYHQLQLQFLWTFISTFLRDFFCCFLSKSHDCICKASVSLGNTSKILGCMLLSTVWDVPTTEVPTNTKTNHFQVHRWHLVNFYVLQNYTYFIQDSNVSVFCNNYLPTFK